MYSFDEYNALKTKYGAYSSWAIWDYQNESDTLVIDKNFQVLHSNFVFLALNISGSLKDNKWINFHGGKHDRKLKYASNDTMLKGSYITDLFKDLPEVKSNKVKDKLSSEIITQNVTSFNQEMQDIKINNKTTFIVFGTQNSQIANMFNSYFLQKYNNPVIYYYHYSFYGMSDEAWVQGLWDKLGIDADYKSIISKYK